MNIFSFLQNKFQTHIDNTSLGCYSQEDMSLFAVFPNSVSFTLMSLQKHSVCIKAHVFNIFILKIAQGKQQIN